MSKAMERLQKKQRRRQIRHEALRILNPMLKRWQELKASGIECAEQGEGILGRREIIDLEEARSRLKKAGLEKYAYLKEERRKEQIARREARCRRSL